MRTQHAARKLTAELTSLYVRYKNAQRAVLPTGVTRPAEVADLGPSAVACIRRTLAALAELASAVLGDVERLAAKHRSARAECERLREDARDQTICNAITSGEVQVELNAIVALYGIFPYGQVMAALAGSAFAPAGDHGLSRSTLDTARHQSLIFRNEFDPSSAVVAIKKAIQKGKRSESSLDWVEITRAIYGLFSAVPMSSNYHDKELNLATSVCDMDVLLLQSPGDRFERHHAEEALWLLKRF